MIAVVVAQSAIVGFMMRAGGGLGPRPPNILAAIVAADLGAALSQDAALDLQDYVEREYGRIQTVTVVTKDGRVASNRDEPLAEGVRRSVDAMRCSPGRASIAAASPGSKGRRWCASL